MLSNTLIQRATGAAMVAVGGIVAEVNSTLVGVLCSCIGLLITFAAPALWKIARGTERTESRLKRVEESLAKSDKRHRRFVRWIRDHELEHGLSAQRSHDGNR